MWILRRLKSLGCETAELLDVLLQHVLSIAEQAVPHWGPMVTKTESNMIERILKTGLQIIFQNQYISFKHALKKANIKSLAQRRKDLISKFCAQAVKSDKYSEWFKPENPKSENQVQTRSVKPRFKPVICRTSKFERSALPVMTHVASWHPPLTYFPPNIN